MMKTLALFLILTTLAVPVYAQTEALETHHDKDSINGARWTEIGGYLFAPTITGESQVRAIRSDLDVSFDDILKNLNLGAMAFVEHHEARLSFIGDLFYADLEADKTKTRGSVLSLTADAKLTQILAEGFVSYRVFDRLVNEVPLGIDALAGVRYNTLELTLDSRTTALGLARSASRKRREDWIDGVGGVRVQYGNPLGWGVMGWADYGAAPHSHSYQIAGFVTYRFDNRIAVFGGYRHYAFAYATGSGDSRFKIDADYSGPMMGCAYRF